MYSMPTDVRNALAPGVWPVPDTDPVPVTRTAADLTDAQLSDAIAEADSLIDSYLGGRYATPVEAIEGVVPSPVRWWSRDIAAYGATLTYRKGKDLSPTDPVALRYAQVMQQLNSAQAGRTSLNLPTNSGPSGTGGAAAAINPYVGDLFGPEDFNLSTIPYRPVTPSPFWRSP